MRVRLTLDYRTGVLLEEEAAKYNLSVNGLINRIVSCSEELKPRLYKIDKENVKKDVKINARNKMIWNEVLCKYDDASASELLRGYVSSYLLLPIYLRENIVYRDIINQINFAKDNKKSLKIKYSKDGYGHEERKIDPYVIVTTQSEENNYLIAYCHKRKDIRNFRISRIESVKNCKTEFFVKDRYKEIIERAKKYFDGFLSYNQYVKIEFTEVGLGMLNRLTLNKPIEISKEDIIKEPDVYSGVSISEKDIENEKIKVFECSEYQCEAYFFQYLENILILEPSSARNRMYEKLTKSIEKIKEISENE